MPLFEHELEPLTTFKERVQGLDFPTVTLNAVYIFPDDFSTAPDLTPPFAVIGVLEGVRTVSQVSFNQVKRDYGMYIRFCLRSKQIDPTTAEFAQLELEAREIFSVLGSELYENDSSVFFGPASRIPPSITESLDYIISGGQPFTGCQLEIPVTQEI